MPEALRLTPQLIRRLIAGVIFVIIGIYLAGVVPSTEIAWVSAILLLTIYLFAFEIVEVDVAAVSIMVLLGLTALLAPLLGLTEPLVPPRACLTAFPVTQ